MKIFYTKRLSVGDWSQTFVRFLIDTCVHGSAVEHVFYSLKIYADGFRSCDEG